DSVCSCIYPRSLHDALPISGISSFLAAKDTVFAAPFRLQFNSGLCATGNKVYGKGFVLDETAALSLIAKEPRNEQVVLPWIIGEDRKSTRLNYSHGSISYAV